MEGLQAALRRLTDLPARLKIAASAAIVACLIVGGVALNLARDSRVALFATPLHADQLAEVETRLAAWRVPYALQADNVRVDARNRGDLLLRLSLAGVPHPHLETSDEAFAHVGALTPQSVLDVQTRDALAADLAQGLRGLDGVADARVIVAPASGGVYADEPARDASASVRISLAPGAHLGSATVAGIRAFVAGGVPGLDAERVTVLDDRGVLDGGGGEPDDASVQTSLQSALDGAFGPGTTIVRVHREPSGERRDERDIKRVALPGEITHAGSDERYSAEKKTYQKSTATDERGSEMHDVHRVAAEDATARLSVAIFVDGARAIDLDKIRALGAAAAGIDPARGDTIRVEAVRFAPGPPLPMRGIDGWAIAGLFAGLIPQLAVVAGGVALVTLGARPAYALAVRAVEAAGVRSAAEQSAGLPPARIRGALAGEPPHVAAAVISALPAATATAVLESIRPTNARRSCGGSRARPSISFRIPRNCCAPVDDRRFVPLARWLRGPSVEDGALSVPALPELTTETPPVEPPQAPQRELAEVLREVRVFRAQLADAFEAACAALIPEFAYAVIGRELVLAPADVAAIAARILAEHPAAQSPCVRIAPSDAERVGGRFAHVVDDALAPGDAVIEFAGGFVDARLGVRLAAVIAAWL